MEENRKSRSEDEDKARKRASFKRKCSFRELLNRIEGLEESEDVGIEAAKEVGLILKEINELDKQCDFSERVEYPDETILESKVVASCSTVLVKCIENNNTFEFTYESTEFAAKLLNELCDENEEFKEDNWLKILEEAREMIPDVPHYSFLYGTFDPTKIPEKKQRKERCKKDANEKVEKKLLKKVENADKDEEGVDDTVNFLENVLIKEYNNNDSNPVEYYKFVIDSENFGSTIENMFYCAFLLRDGKAKLDVGSDGIPTLQPMRKRDLKAFRDGGGVNRQLMTSTTMDEWEVLREKIPEGYIQKHRQQMNSQK